MGGNKVTGAADPTVATDLATKNYVDTTTAAFFSTGDVKLTIKTVADTGWILVTSNSFGNGTIGSATSGANIRANADTQSLFNLLFSNFSDANAPLFTSGGAATTRAAQTNAATAWAANCRMQVGFFAARTLGITGNPGDLTNRNLGDHVGEENHLLSTSEMPAHNHGITDPGHTHPQANAPAGGQVGGFLQQNTSGVLANVVPTPTFSNTTGITINNAGGGSAHNNMPPTAFLNCMIKL